jgi:hypothetical protein
VCNFRISQSRTPKKGVSVTYSVDPPVEFPCTVVPSVNGRRITDLGPNGDLRILGVGATGSVSVVPFTDPPTGSVSFVVRCPGPPQRSYEQVFVLGAIESVAVSPANDSMPDLPFRAKPDIRIRPDDEDHNRAVAAREDGEREHAGELKGREEKGRVVVPIPLIPNPFSNDDGPKKPPLEEDR